MPEGSSSAFSTLISTFFRLRLTSLSPIDECRDQEEDVETGQLGQAEAAVDNELDRVKNSAQTKSHPQQCLWPTRALAPCTLHPPQPTPTGTLRPHLSVYHAPSRSPNLTTPNPKPILQIVHDE